MSDKLQIIQRVCQEMFGTGERKIIYRSGKKAKKVTPRNRPPQKTIDGKSGINKVKAPV